MKDAIDFMFLIALIFLAFAAAGIGAVIWFDVWDRLRSRLRSKAPPQKPRVSWPPID